MPATQVPAPLQVNPPQVGCWSSHVLMTQVGIRLQVTVLSHVTATQVNAQVTPPGAQVTPPWQVGPMQVDRALQVLPPKQVLPHRQVACRQVNCPAHVLGPSQVTQPQVAAPRQVAPRQVQRQVAAPWQVKPPPAHVPCPKQVHPAQVGCPQVRAHVGAWTQVCCAHVFSFRQVKRQVGTPEHVTMQVAPHEVKSLTHVFPTQVFPTQVGRPPQVLAEQVGCCRHVGQAPHVLVQQVGPTQVTAPSQVRPPSLQVATSHVAWCPHVFPATVGGGQSLHVTAQVSPAQVAPPQVAPPQVAPLQVKPPLAQVERLQVHAPPTVGPSGHWASSPLASLAVALSASSRAGSPVYNFNRLSYTWSWKSGDMVASCSATRGTADASKASTASAHTFVRFLIGLFLTDWLLGDSILKSHSGAIREPDRVVSDHRHHPPSTPAGASPPPPRAAVR